MYGRRCDGNLGVGGGQEHGGRFHANGGRGGKEQVLLSSMDSGNTQVCPVSMALIQIVTLDLICFGIILYKQFFAISLKTN